MKEEIKQLLNSDNLEDRKLGAIFILKTLSSEEARDILGTSSEEHIGGNFRYEEHYPRELLNIGYKYEDRFIFFGCSFLELVDKKINPSRFTMFNYNYIEI